MKGFAAFFAAVALVPSVLAHGFVKEVRAPGKNYKGVMTGRGSGGNSGVVRKINIANPNHLRDTTALPCGPGANTRFATEFVTVKPGDNLGLVWDGGSGKSRWPHNLGPMVNYIAQCKTAGCKDDASKLVFYKISQQGLKNDQSANSNGGAWFQGDVMRGAPAGVKIPAGLANGDYILRHEIIALHEGNNPRMGPEFYPSCINIRVSGGAASFKVNGEGVTFPAGYKTGSIGNKELTKTIFRNWRNNVSKYNFPGPAIATFSGSAAAPAKVAAVADKKTDDNDDDDTAAGQGASADDYDDAEDDDEDDDDDCTDDDDQTTNKTTTSSSGKTKRHGPNRFPSSHFSD